MSFEQPTYEEALLQNDAAGVELAPHDRFLQAIEAALDVSQGSAHPLEYADELVQAPISRWKKLLDHVPGYLRTLIQALALSTVLGAGEVAAASPTAPRGFITTEGKEVSTQKLELLREEVKGAYGYDALPHLVGASGEVVLRLPENIRKSDKHLFITVLGQQHLLRDSPASNQESVDGTAHSQRVIAKIIADHTAELRKLNLPENPVYVEGLHEGNMEFFEELGDLRRKIKAIDDPNFLKKYYKELREAYERSISRFHMTYVNHLFAERFAEMGYTEDSYRQFTKNGDVFSLAPTNQLPTHSGHTTTSEVQLFGKYALDVPIAPVESRWADLDQFEVAQKYDLLSTRLIIILTALITDASKKVGLNESVLAALQDAPFALFDENVNLLTPQKRKSLQGIIVKDKQFMATVGDLKRLVESERAYIFDKREMLTLKNIATHSLAAPKNGYLWVMGQLHCDTIPKTAKKFEIANPGYKFTVMCVKTTAEMTTPTP